MNIARLVIAFFLISSFTASGQVNLSKIKKAIKGESLSAEEVAQGLKEALAQGTSKGSDQVSKTDGYFKNPSIKILFPPDVKQVENKLRAAGLGSEVDKFVLSLNRAAEDAAREAKPIFLSAIKQMSIDDAWKILKGKDDEATQYLTRTTSQQLKDKFMPIVKASLEKVNATKYYSDLITTYNKLPLVQKVEPDLNEYATNKAIEGLFFMIAQEEKNIRNNPGARTSELLKRVFGSQN